MARARLTRVVRFNAAHRYYRPEWSEERNRAAFGACANEHGHGHSYHCAVTVSGNISADRSMVIDLEEFDELLRDVIVHPMDHQHLNYAIPEFDFGKTIPTAEALSVWIWQRLMPKLPEGVRLDIVRVQEDETLFAEYRGDQ